MAQLYKRIQLSPNQQQKDQQYNCMYNSVEQLLRERNLVELKASSFTKQMLSNYDQSSIHILIYAVQNQFPLPSKSSIVKANRRQEKKQTGKNRGRFKGRLRRSTINNSSGTPMSVPFTNSGVLNENLPGLRNWTQSNRVLPPFSIMFPNSNIQSIGMNPVIGHPTYSMFFPIGLPHPSMIPLLPLNPPSSLQNFPNPSSQFHYTPYPSQLQPILPMRPNAKRKRVNKIQIDQDHPFHNRFAGSLQKKSQIKQTRRSTNDKEVEKGNKYKVLSPEQITLKNLRKKCQNQLKKQLKQIGEEKNQTQKIEKKPIPVYFQKKKESQKRRRQQKHELIKKNRSALLKIFGTVIFKKGWFISRKDILEALNVPSLQERQSIEGIDELFASDNAEEKLDLDKQEAIDSIAQFFMLQETSPEVCVQYCVSN